MLFLSKTILQNYLLHFEWLINAVSALEKIQISSKKSFITSTTWVNIVPYFILLKCTIQGVDEAWPTYFYKCVCPAGQTHPMLRNLSCSLNKLHLDKCQLANRLGIVHFSNEHHLTLDLKRKCASALSFSSLLFKFRVE